MASKTCSINVENHFGPVVNGCGDDVDFTLLFEDAILLLVPTVLSILVGLCRVSYLRGRSQKIRTSLNYWVKLIFHAIYILLQLVSLVIWTLPSTPKTSLSLPSSVASLLAAITAIYLSHLEHICCIRPSTCLVLHYSVVWVLGIPRSRTLLSVSGLHTLASIHIASLVVILALVILESMEKMHTVLPHCRSESLEMGAGAISRSLFWWLNPLLLLGCKGTLLMRDLLRIDSSICADQTDQVRLVMGWARCREHGKWYHVLLPLFQVLKGELLRGAIPRLAQGGFLLSQPYLIKRAIILFAMPDSSTNYKKGLLLTVAFALAFVGIGVATTRARHHSNRLASKLRGILMAIVYDKIFDSQLQPHDVAIVTTMITTHTERITIGMQTIQDTWGCLAEVILIIWLLSDPLRIADLPPVFISLVCVVAVAGAVGYLVQRQALWLKAIKTRVGATAAMLKAMKSIKMSGMARILYDQMRSLRDNEVRCSRGYRMLLTVITLLVHANTFVTPVVALSMYNLLARQKEWTETLDSPRAFTALAFLTILASSFVGLLQSLTELSTALGCIDSIREFVLQPSRAEGRWLPEAYGLMLLRDEVLSKASCSGHVVAQALSLAWEDDTPILQDLSFVLNRGTLVMVNGPVGGGKSTLLRAILGEVPKVTGKLTVAARSVAYCAQSPWIVSGTIQENIRGPGSGARSLLDWYATVLDACDLHKDLASLPEGDLTVVGGQGLGLSGGQQQRLALARAIFCQADLVLLDDVMSGLDSATEEHVFHRVLGPHGLLRTPGVTVVVATSSPRWLAFADQVLTVGADGSVTSLTQRVSSDLTISNDNASSVTLVAAAELSGVASPVQADENETRPPIKASADRDLADVSIYRYYLATAPSGAWLLVYGSLAALVALHTFMSVWVKWWAEDNDREPNRNLNMRVGIYWLLGALVAGFFLLTPWCLWSLVAPRTMVALHRDLLQTVLNAPFSFLSSVDAGETLNRFSQDLELIDFQVPEFLMLFSLTLLMCIAQMIVIAIQVHYAAAALPACLVVFYVVQRFYTRTSRQLRILDLEARAPLLSLLLETIQGLETIRAFDWSNKYRQRYHGLLVEAQKPFYLLYAVQTWLALVLDLSLAGFVVVVMGIGVASLGKISPAAMGLALVNIIAFGTSVKLLTTYWASLETSLGAVARIKSFVERTPSEMLEHAPHEVSDQLPQHWPVEGSIEFRNVSVAYGAQSTPTVRKISLSIPAGQKVAICGRTASGKTSLITTMFGISDLTDGEILIDGRSISTIDRTSLRTAIVGVPQDSFILEGCSLRRNLDPFDVHGDDTVVMHALSTVGLGHLINPDFGLETVVDENALTPGQKQLLCLARASLRPGRVVVLDEPTSSVDQETEAQMQSIIQTAFAGRTVIMVTHRIRAVIEYGYDRVIVMRDGEIVEEGAPQELVQRKTEGGEGVGVFRELYLRESGEGT
ncbi:P-loop containing nucleoside triphosphate hydrolase protein [Aspergillus japonicus CBS 114.51]|uniref:P-loop containing nucleoside triphosphate hydrolase protein n=1 Tax=Aspergillus japonicus CBS 114.51 TaxID=1448312 RepID=A0A8T8WMX9_ASPJA|nr:P-loop containing nucleoside triphosphate hydrolase protein [Aspergillus japonicus CBS 114.51]RAH77151.1 P-loop containing nucleoside triphosphate hydrolase protein [Aspergillus japonicus CBS 114.51]